MKTRIISAAVGIVLLIAVLLCPYTVVLAVLLAALAALAVWELLHATGRIGCRALTGGCMAFAALWVLLCYFWEWAAKVILFSGEERKPDGYSELFTLFVLLMLAFVVLIVLFGILLLLVALRRHADTEVSAVGYAAFVTAYAAAGFGALAALRELPQHGMLYVLIALIIPWMSDTGAYFVGTFLGRHKMTPVISPKKSWEGFFGGWAIAVGSAVLTGWLYHLITGQSGHYLPLAVLAFVLAPLSVCGDLFASVIKRQSGIKDYGHIMPGHGGVMDRFDSVIAIAPVLHLLLFLLIAFGQIAA